jgi:nucleotide-binding universal stress UspA family protein
MLKSIALLLDGMPGGESAQHLALDIAQRHGALVTAVCALNLDALTVPLGFFSESLAYSDINRVKVVETRQRDLDAMCENLTKACLKAGIRHDVIAAKGTVYAELARAAVSHDLVVLGNDIRFGNIAGQNDVAAVGLLLKNVPRPLLVAPPKLPEGTDVVVAFDGSAPSARALQMFVLLGLAEDRTLRIVTIHKDLRVAEAVARDATLFLDRHGVKNSAKVVKGSNLPSDVILEEIRQHGAGMLVMGAFGHRGWREVMLGSSTSALLGYANVPIFVDH